MREFSLENGRSIYRPTQKVLVFLPVFRVRLIQGNMMDYNESFRKEFLCDQRIAFSICQRISLQPDNKVIRLLN